MHCHGRVEIVFHVRHREVAPVVDLAGKLEAGNPNGRQNPCLVADGHAQKGFVQGSPARNNGIEDAAIPKQSVDFQVETSGFDTTQWHPIGRGSGTSIDNPIHIALEPIRFERNPLRLG